MTTRSCAIYATGIICLLILGITLLVAQDQTMTEERTKKEITLGEKSRVSEGQMNPLPPVDIQYFFFSVTNPDEFLAGEEKAKINQMGPYTYREYRPRENVTFLENGKKIFTTNSKSFVFLRNMSAGDPEVDRVITVNIPFHAVTNNMNFYSFFLRAASSMWMRSMNISVFMNRTVSEILWGFKDPLLSKLHSIKPEAEIEEYFRLMDNSSSAYGEIDTWNSIRQRNWWSSNLSRKELLHNFAADMCRSINMGYACDKEVKGIPADVLAPLDENPSNASFCVPDGDYLGKGVLKVSTCRQSVPIVVSFPHFYKADEKYINAIEGMNPNEEEHETHIDINPTTGVPIRAYKRAQLNVILKTITGLPMKKFLDETIFPIMYVNEEITLGEKSRVSEDWINPPPPVDIQYFFFNITNPDEFFAGEEKAKVTQMGPYTYREYRPREKGKITFLENGTKIFATNSKSFVFLRNMSAGDPEVDRVITVNIPFFAIAKELNFYSFFLRAAISMWMRSMNIGVSMNRTVSEILWGFKDPLLSKLHSIKPEIEDYFALMYNSSSADGKIDTWNSIRQKNWWSSNLSRKELLHNFAADMCRSIYMGYMCDKELPVPSNAGFCVPDGDYLGKGVLKVSACQQGVPIVVSFPHFYKADEKYINAIEGMNPNEEEHETYIDINPTTGVPIRARKRAQLNVILKRVPGFPMTKFLGDIIFPIMYVNEIATIDDDSR